jgi:N-acetylglutamate synthase-like GNAT family acetyltransferase
MSLEIRRLTEGDRSWVQPRIDELWGAPGVVSRGRIYEPARLPGFVAVEEGDAVGLVTYAIEDERCEIVTLNSFIERRGVGSRLVESVKRAASEAGCTKLWLVTTNDNLEALGFYQKRGFVLAAIHRNALDLSRRLKPEIPTLGRHGIPLRDEIELEMAL